jgi:type II secretory pathway component PulM
MSLVPSVVQVAVVPVSVSTVLEALSEVNSNSGITVAEDVAL